MSFEGARVVIRGDYDAGTQNAMESALTAVGATVLHRMSPSCTHIIATPEFVASREGGKWLAKYATVPVITDLSGLIGGAAGVAAGSPAGSAADGGGAAVSGRKRRARTSAAAAIAAASADSDEDDEEAAPPPKKRAGGGKGAAAVAAYAAPPAAAAAPASTLPPVPVSLRVLRADRTGASNVPLTLTIDAATISTVGHLKHAILCQHTDLQPAASGAGWFTVPSALAAPAARQAAGDAIKLTCSGVELLDGLTTVQALQSAGVNGLPVAADDADVVKPHAAGAAGAGGVVSVTVLCSRRPPSTYVPAAVAARAADPGYVPAPPKKRAPKRAAPPSYDAVTAALGLPSDASHDVLAAAIAANMVSGKMGPVPGMAAVGGAGTGKPGGGYSNAAGGAAYAGSSSSSAAAAGGYSASSGSFSSSSLLPYAGGAFPAAVPGERRIKPWVAHPSPDDAARIVRALKERMYKLDHEDLPPPQLGRIYAVMGSKGSAYKVTISHRCTCTCMDYRMHGGRACKHIMFALHKILGVPHEHPLAWQGSLMTHELTYILEHTREPAPEVVANADLLDELAHLPPGDRRRVLGSAAPMLSKRAVPGGAVVGGAAAAAALAPSLPVAPAAPAYPLGQEPGRKPVDADDDCAICYDALGGSLPLLTYCSSCGNNAHKDCMAKWAAAKRAAYQTVTCPHCRAPWTDPYAR